MKGVSARTYSTNYLTTDSEMLLLTYLQQSLSTDVNKYKCLTNNLSNMKTKPTNRLLTDRSD